MPFDREAVFKGIERATIRKYSASELEALVSKVFDDAFAVSDDTGLVTTEQIAKAVLTNLRAVDPASHIRFALVQLGRRERRRGPSGWIDADDVRSWLRDEYPALENWSPPARLVSVVKRDGRREAFDRRKLERSIGRAAKGRDSRENIRSLATSIARDAMRELDVQPLVTSGQLAAQVLRTLREWDQIAYLRYASATKNYVDETDYEAEAVMVRNYHLQRARGLDPANEHGTS